MPESAPATPADAASAAPPAELVATPEGLERLAARVRGAARVAIDTEFHQERSYAARLMVVQVAFEDGVALVDPLALPDLRPLVEALDATLVVGHALGGDLRIFADRYDRVPGRVFDCQVAAAFCGFGQSVSLLDAVQALAGVRLRKSQTVSDWSQRPFTARQIEYLVDDVAYLFTLQDRLTERLARVGRLAWAEEEMRDLGLIETYRPDPTRLYLRLQGAARMGRRDLGALRELAYLRDRLARERDVPPKYIFPDDALSGLVALAPKSLEELAQLRRLEPGVRKSFGPEILAAVKRAAELPEDELPQRPPRQPALHREAIVALCAVLVNAVAAEHDVPSSLLAPRTTLERIVRELPASVEALAEILGPSPWRAQLLAEPLLRLLRGETTLRVVGAREDRPQIAILPADALPSAAAPATEAAAAG